MTRSGLSRTVSVSFEVRRAVSRLVYIFMDKVPVVADLNFLDNTFQDTCTQTPLNVLLKKSEKPAAKGPKGKSSKNNNGVITKRLFPEL